METKTSPTPTVPKSKSAFTLIELLIVVVLIAILYGVFISKLQQRTPKDAAQSLNLFTLQKTLGLFPAEQQRSLVCTEPCTSCSIYLGDKALEGTEIPLFNTPPVTWRQDRYGQYFKTEFTPVIDPEHGTTNVCFRYELFRNGSGSSYIVQTDDTHFYAFKPYLHPVRLYASINDAKTAMDSEALLPTELRNYDF